MVERLVVGGREVVQIPVEDYNSIMEYIATEKNKMEDYYVKRYEMAKQCVAEGRTFGLDELDSVFARCRARAAGRRLGNAANE
jgi:hypothetical protein